MDEDTLTLGALLAGFLVFLLISASLAWPHIVAGEHPYLFGPEKTLCVPNADNSLTCERIWWEK